MTVRRVLLAAALTAGAFAATTMTAGPASAGCGTVGDYQVCNPVVEKVQDLLRPTP